MIHFLKIATLSLLVSTTGLAATAKGIPGAYLNMFFGPFVHKSDSVGGTDFSNFLGVNAGVNYGKDKQVAFSFHNDRMSTDFRQSESSISSDFTQFSMGYRFLWFHPSIIAGHGTMEASSDDPDVGEVFDVVFTNFGFGLDVEIPYTAVINTYVKIHSLDTTKVVDADGNDINFGTRTEVDAGVTIALPFPILMVNTGYLHRSFSVEVEEGGLKQQIQTGPYLGFTLGHSF
ncbi:hypothetical protein N9D31_00525 [Oligoflexaceae bacterium]|nr:hypothetical protein [Oligoflexaceae bacterium]